jgi:hypothetical protein
MKTGYKLTGGRIVVPFYNIRALYQQVWKTSQAVGRVVGGTDDLYQQVWKTSQYY